MISIKLCCVAALFVFLSGCDSNPERRKALGDGMSMFTEDLTGDKWIVEHHLGDRYTIKQCKDVFKDKKMCEKVKQNKEM